MSQPIRTVIVDDIPEAREHVTELLRLERDIEVVGSAASGEEAVEIVSRVPVDVVLMDINMPGIDGITATEQLTAQNPGLAVIIMSVEREANHLRRAMLAGAREFLVKPFTSDELVASIRKLYLRQRDDVARVPRAADGTNGRTPGVPARKPGKIVTLFSPKGGVGRTTIAVNLAVAAATELDKKVVLVDGSFQFGDVGALLNLDPKDASIANLIPEMAAGVPESLDQVLVKHTSGIKVLLAPPGPEVAELITSAYLRSVLEKLRETHDVIVVDSWPWLNETTLSLLDLSDRILTLLTLEISNVKNVRLFLEVADQLGYPQEKVRLVLNRADTAWGIRVTDVESALGRSVDHTIVGDWRNVVQALNRGVPFVASNRTAQVSQDITRLARAVAEDGPAAMLEASDRRPRRFLSFARR